ncbi:MAG: MAPEG family protein [Paracoccaceae bacterium]
MLFWLLAGLALYLVYVYTPMMLFLPQEGILARMGGRDAMPEASVMVGRARRALANIQENMLFFLTLGVLAFVVEGADMPLAIKGAMIFVVARAAYLPAYMISIPGLRSLLYMVGLAGNVMMAAALL